MIIYENTKGGFVQDIRTGCIAQKVVAAFKAHGLSHDNDGSEVSSWDHSLLYMRNVLDDDAIPDDVTLAVEYQIPLTAKRVDFMLAGRDENDRPNVVIVELKQWTSLKAVKGKDALVETITGHSLRQVVHPSYQAWSYAALIKDYSDIVQDEEIELSPCAYLHNYEPEENDPLFDEQYQDYLEEAPAFAKKDIRKLREFIKKSVVYGDNGDTIYKIDHGKIRPSKSLQDAIASMVKGNDEFIMIDDQKVVYERILEVSRQCVKDKKRCCFQHRSNFVCVPLVILHNT